MKLTFRTVSGTIVPCTLFLILALAAPLCAADGDYRSAILIEAATGNVLFADGEHERRPPASMVKMMTELIVLELVAAGEIAMEDPCGSRRCRATWAALRST